MTPFRPIAPRGRRSLRWAGLVAVAVATLALVTSGAVAPELPTRLTDAEFWHIVSTFSEPDGPFPANNFVSNEIALQSVVPRLKAQLARGGIYVGVGPDQNFTYIVALAPAVAFIVDIRRQNLLHHLLYKALIELSADRHEFLQRLFGRPSTSPIQASDVSLETLLAAVASDPRDTTYFDDTVRDVLERLETTRGFSLTAEDRYVLHRVHRAFFDFGPDISYAPLPPSIVSSASAARLLSPFPSYADLVSGQDGAGTNQSYLATAEHYQSLREMQLRNLIVPIVGDFAGEKALGAVGDWARQHDGTVTAFYTSNVEQYLFQNNVFAAFYDTVATLPLDDTSTFIRAFFPSGAYFPGRARIVVGPGQTLPIDPPSRVDAPQFVESSSLLDPIQHMLAALARGEISSYQDVVTRSR